MKLRYINGIASVVQCIYCKLLKNTTIYSIANYFTNAFENKNQQFESITTKMEFFMDPSYENISIKTQFGNAVVNV